MTAEHSPPRFGVFSEHLAPAEVDQPRILDALARRDIELVYGTRAPLRDDVIGLRLACRARGIHFALWPMLPDEGGRWANVHNDSLFGPMLTDALTRLRAADAEPDGLVVDLEPPIRSVRAIVHWRRPTIRRGPSAMPRVARAIERASSGGLEVWATLAPPAAVSRGWQALLGTPADRLPLVRQSAMLYSTLLVGYARGLLRQADADALVHLGTVACRRRHGAATSVCVGAVGPGALGDERTYASPAALARDVAIARAAGARHITLFDLRGALRRPPLEEWLDALTKTPPATVRPPLTARSLAIGGAIWLVGRLYPE